MNPLDNVFCLSNDGNMLGVSFEDGSLWVKDISDASGDNEIEIFDGTEGYNHIEGFFTDGPSKSLDYTLCKMKKYFSNK